MIDEILSSPSCYSSRRSTQARICRGFEHLRRPWWAEGKRTKPLLALCQRHYSEFGRLCSTCPLTLILSLIYPAVSPVFSPYPIPPNPFARSVDVDQVPGLLASTLLNSMHSMARLLAGGESMPSSVYDLSSKGRSRLPELSLELRVQVGGLRSLEGRLGRPCVLFCGRLPALMRIQLL